MAVCGKWHRVLQWAGTSQKHQAQTVCSIEACCCGSLFISALQEIKNIISSSSARFASKRNADYTKFISLNDYIFYVRKKSNSFVWERCMLRVWGYGPYSTEDNGHAVAERRLSHLHVEKTEGMTSFERLQVLAEVRLKIRVIWGVIPRGPIKHLATFRRILES